MANARNVLRLLHNLVDEVFVNTVETDFVSSQDQAAFESVSNLFVSLCKPEQVPTSSSQPSSSQSSQNYGMQLRSRKFDILPLNSQSSSSFEPSSQTSEERLKIEQISETNRLKIISRAKANIKAGKSFASIRRTFGLASNRTIYSLIDHEQGTKRICFAKIRSYVINQIHLHR